MGEDEGRQKQQGVKHNRMSKITGRQKLSIFLIIVKTVRRELALALILKSAEDGGRTHERLHEQALNLSPLTTRQPPPCDFLY